MSDRPKQVSFTGCRFQPKKHNKDAWFVLDAEHKKWNLPEQATTLFLSEVGAMRIATILNEEWSAFLRNPT